MHLPNVPFVPRLPSKWVKNPPGVLIWASSILPLPLLPSWVILVTGGGNKTTIDSAESECGVREECGYTSLNSNLNAKPATKRTDDYRTKD